MRYTAVHHVHECGNHEYRKAQTERSRPGSQNLVIPPSGYPLKLESWWSRILFTSLIFSTLRTVDSSPLQPQFAPRPEKLPRDALSNHTRSQPLLATLQNISCAPAPTCTHLFMPCAQHQRVTRNAPASSTPLPLVRDQPRLDHIQHDDDARVFVAAGNDGKNLMLHLAKNFLKRLDGLSPSAINDIESRWRAAASDWPITVSYDVIEQPFTRDKRISFADRNKMIAHHIEENCALEAEIYHPDGSKEGNVLIFKAQRIDNPLRMLYDDIDDYDPSTVVETTGHGLNFVSDIFTMGIKPLFSNIWANHYRKEFYRQLDDKICTERYNHINFANLVTNLDMSSISYRLAPKKFRFKPQELQNLRPINIDAAYIVRNREENIYKAIWVRAKIQGSASTGHIVKLRPTKNNEFETVPTPIVNKPTPPSKRVIFDNEKKQWHFSEDADKRPLDIELIEGQKYIKLYGDNYQLQSDGKINFHITTNNNHQAHTPIAVYQDLLSGTWHLEQLNGLPTYTSGEQQLIERIKITRNPQFRYDHIQALNPDEYGDGFLFEVRNKQDELATSSPLYQVVEMHGALVPVRTAIMQGHGVHYSAYDTRFPQLSGHRIAWNGEHWHLEKWSSPHVSKELAQRITPEMFSDKKNPGHLSNSDQQGIRWIDNQGYIKIRGHYIEIHQGTPMRIGPKLGKQLPVVYKNQQFYPATSGNFKAKHNLLSMEDVANTLKDISKSILRETTLLKEIEQSIRTLVMASAKQDPAEKITANDDLALSSTTPWPKHVSVHVESVPSAELDNKRFIVTLNNNEHLVVDISRDNEQVRVLLDDEEEIAIEKYRKTLSGGNTNVVAALKRDSEIPLVHPDTRNEIDLKARQWIASGTALLRDTLDRIYGEDRQKKVLLVAHDDFFNTAQFENNVFSSSRNVYMAMVDYLLPLSAEYPEAIIVPGSVYISQDISDELANNAMRYQQGKMTRNVINAFNFAATVVPVVHNGKFITIARKGEFLSYKKSNAAPDQPAIKLDYLDEPIPRGATLIVEGIKPTTSSEASELFDARTGTIFAGKTLFANERIQPDWFCCSGIGERGARQSENYFSNEFMIGDEKFLLVIGDEFIQHGDSRPSVRTMAFPQQETVDDANRYDWVIHCAGADILDDTLKAVGYNAIVASEFDNAEFQSNVSQRLRIWSYQPEKKLSLYEFIKDE